MEIHVHYFIAILFFSISSCQHKNPASKLKNWDLNEIRIRDPFIVKETDTKMYYLYAQKGNRMAS